LGVSLREVKKLLNIDQQNILVCTVVSDFDDHSTVRTPDGKQVRASKTAGAFFTSGDQVEVRTDKKIYTIIGKSSYSKYSADRDYAL
jgi:hypothetical protein